MQFYLLRGNLPLSSNCEDSETLTSKWRHALTEKGEFIIASNTGSQLPHIVFTSPNLIFVVSTKKIVPTLTDAITRLEDHVLPLEDKSIMDKFNIHTMLSKIVIFKRENPMMGRKVRMILVNEDLGF